MTKHCPTCGRIRSDFFFPAEAILGYTSRLAGDPTVVARRQKVIEFTQKLHAVLGPSVGPYYHLHEGLLVLTAAGLDGPGVQVDCVAITHIGVFVVSQVDWTGMVSSSLEKGKLRVTNAEGMTDIHPCPLRYTAPAVHFLGAVLDDCPIESIAVADDETCEFALGLSPSLLKLSELHHFLRVRRERYYRSGIPFVNIKEMEGRLFAACTT